MKQVLRKRLSGCTMMAKSSSEFAVSNSPASRRNLSQPFTIYDDGRPFRSRRRTPNASSRPEASEIQYPLKAVACKGEIRGQTPCVDLSAAF
jgi:hypothetical protein